MKRRTFLLAAPLMAAAASPLLAQVDAEITRVVVYKRRRRLYLVSGDKVVKTYRIGLGFAPKGPKRFEGDGKTPEGSYFIDRRNRNSKFYLSLGISYPNARDRLYARLHRKKPGGEIFIHGRAGQHRGKGRDWTAGCIAVRDDHMREIYNAVRVGTQIDIFA